MTNIFIGHILAKIVETIHHALLEYKFYREISREKTAFLNVSADDYDEQSIYRYDDSVHIGKITAVWLYNICWCKQKYPQLVGALCNRPLNKWSPLHKTDTPTFNKEPF